MNERVLQGGGDAAESLTFSLAEDATEYALQELECASGDGEPCPPVTATATFSLVGIDYGKVEDEERAFRALQREERREKAIEWLRNTKRIFVEQRRLPFAAMHFSSYKRTRARRRVR